ncbi:MAG: ATP-binding protein [bacterium]
MQRSFPREVAALDSVFDLISDFVTAHQIDDGAAFAVRLAVEELFVNMVRYNPGNPNAIRVELSKVGGRIVVTMTDSGVERFDLTKVPAYDGSLSLEARRPGGLGIHLAKKLMDRVEYAYQDGQSTITLTKRLGGHDV